MNKTFIFLSVFIGLAILVPPYKTSNQMGDLNFDELCDGLLFNAIPHPSDGNLFIGCVQGRGTLFGCDEANLVFDPYSVRCVDPADIGTTTTTESIPSTTTTYTNVTVDLPTSTTTQGIITTTTSRTGGGENVDIIFVCPPSGVGNIPHRTECERYFECLRGIQHPRTCPDGFLFDVITKQCQPPEITLCANIIQCS
ncbi:hypothetical protein ACKWTF_013120 [Chironomus riparius]